MSDSAVLARVCAGLALLACSVSAIACGHEVDPDYSNPEPPTSPYAGLYTPGSTIGAIASDSADAGLMGDDAPPTVLNVHGDRCVGTSGEPGTASMLTVDFNTQLIGGFWKPANIGAVWIEQESGDEGVYVKTLERWAAVESKFLYAWNKRACPTWPEADAVSQATMPDHSKAHSSMWDGKDLKGHVVPDGMYKLYIEVTETETDYGPVAIYEFTKGSMEQTLEPPDETAVKGLKIVYTPSM